MKNASKSGMKYTVNEMDMSDDEATAYNEEARQRISDVAEQMFIRHRQEFESDLTNHPRRMMWRDKYTGRKAREMRKQYREKKKSGKR